MTFANPTTRAQAKQMMLDALDGKTVNGARLAKPGSCAYMTVDHALEAKPNCTCIVGSLMTPGQRLAINSIGANDELIEALFRRAERLGVRCAGLPTLESFGGLTLRELQRLQAMFDKRHVYLARPSDEEALTELRDAIAALPDTLRADSHP